MRVLTDGQRLCGRWAMAVARQTRRAFLGQAAGLLALGMGGATLQRANALDVAETALRWVVFYGERTDEKVLASYDLVVLDGAFRGSLDRIAAEGARVCGYLSLGEIRMADPEAQFVDPAVLLAENPDWPGTRRVDIRHPAWRSFVLERRLPALMARGFAGVMYDTLDTPPYLEQVDPVRYAGMRDAAVELLAAIRQRWPNATLIMNRGYALLPDVVQNIDAVIAESLMTMPDSGPGRFKWVADRELNLQLELLKPAAHRHPPLPILSLDYWDPADATTIAEIYRRERALGHHPYVATPALDRIVSERS